MPERIEHPHITSTHAGRGLDGANTLVVFTDIAVDPSDPNFSQGAYESVANAVERYLATHDECARATLVSR